MNLIECYNPIILNMFLDLIIADNNSKFKSMTKIELIDYMQDNIKYFKIENDLLYEVNNNTKTLIFKKSKLNIEALELFRRLENKNKTQEL